LNYAFTLTAHCILLQGFVQERVIANGGKLAPGSYFTISPQAKIVNRSLAPICLAPRDNANAEEVITPDFDPG
jgi:hypothetical protein